MTVLNQHVGHMARILISVSAMALVSGCAVVPTPLSDQEFAAKAADDRKAMFLKQEPLLEKPLTLGDAVARVLRYNLDNRSKMMEQAQALNQLDLDRWDLLPKLTTDAGYMNRSDHATTTSRDSVTLEPALSNPYYSMDRDHFTADLTLSWNVLDFGVSYLTAHQDADRALIAEERRRKTVQNLVQEVRQAYWRALAAQELRGRVETSIADADKALKASSQVEAEHLRNPLDALRYQKTLLESLRQLEAINQELSTARNELAALINVAPGTPLVLEKPSAEEMHLPVWSLPVEQMEELAFAHNADLREQVYQERITVDETRKEFLKLLPGISFSAGRDYDSNSFLQNNAWNEAAAKVSWNLLSLVSAPDRIHNAHNNENIVEARRLALRMAVLAQVHVSRQQYENAASQFGRADALFDVERKIAAATAERQENDAQSVLENIGTQTSAIAAELRRYQSLALAQGALGRVEATLGIDPLSSDMSNADIGTLGDKITARLRKLDRGEIDFAPDLPREEPAAAAAAPQPQASADTGKSEFLDDVQAFLSGIYNKAGTSIHTNSPQ
jgi:outer membrane protein TolC